MTGFFDEAIKNVSMWDWGFAKIGLILFGIMLVSWQPWIPYAIDWYWWWLLVVIGAGYFYYKAEQKRLLKKNQTKMSDSTFVRLFQQGKQNMSIIDWSIAKTVVIIFGIGLCALWPQLPNMLPVIYWLLLWMVFAIIPFYFIYMYNPAKPTTFSQARAQYLRANSPFSKTTRVTQKFIKDDGEHQGGVMFFRKPDAHDAVVRSSLAHEIDPKEGVGWARIDTFRRKKKKNIQILPSRKERK